MAAKTQTREFIFDDKTNAHYEKGRFLGKGGFAKCYEIRNAHTRETYAGKVIPKELLIKDLCKEKVSQEITIHKSLAHKYVVKMYSHFEDKDNIYIVLELCRKRSLMEMHRRRRCLTENEVRYFLRQIVQACIYLHDNKIVHRDLKLGNIFINDDMEIKLGDFGLATYIEHEGERKKTVCGTPNYIAPEILMKRGHSYEVDVWSLGCIMYTLIVGIPPFETKTLKETYARIKKNEYQIPLKVSENAKTLIQKMLSTEPSSRPKMSEILEHGFFTHGYLPPRLPTSCLTVAPRFPAKLNGESPKAVEPPRDEVNNVSDDESPTKKFKQMKLNNTTTEIDRKIEDITFPKDCYLSSLLRQLKSVTEKRPNTPKSQYDEALYPAGVPFIWLSKWVDYTDKYGLGYQLCDNSIAVLFNDCTCLIIFPNERTFSYVSTNGEITYYTINKYPKALEKKFLLMKYFRTYMTDNLLTTGEFVPREGDEFTQLPYLKCYFRTSRAMIFHLSNGTLQINFFADHTKIIICPLMGAVSFIDENKEFLVYKLSLIEKHGCSDVLFKRLQYAKLCTERLIGAGDNVKSFPVKVNGIKRSPPKRRK